MTRRAGDLGWPERAPRRPLRLQPRTVLAAIACALLIQIWGGAAMALWWAL